MVQSWALIPGSPVCLSANAANNRQFRRPHFDPNVASTLGTGHMTADGCMVYSTSTHNKKLEAKGQDRHGMMRFFGDIQGWLYGGATAELRGLAGDFGAVKLLAAAALAAVFGMVHALMPGHGAAAQGIVVAGLIVTAGMALGMIVTIAAFGLAALLLHDRFMHAMDRTSMGISESLLRPIRHITRANAPASRHGHALRSGGGSRRTGPPGPRG